MSKERINGGLFLGVGMGVLCWVVIIMAGLAFLDGCRQREFQRIADIEFEQQVRRTCPQLIDYGLHMDLPECVATFLEHERK